MKDLEEVEFTGAQSNWGYVRATLESWRMVVWMWRELTTPLGRLKLKQMATWAVLRNVVWLSVTYFIALAATAATREQWDVAYLNGRYLIAALALAALFRLAQDRCTEWSLGETIVQVDYALNKRFFDKSLSQHRSKGNVLDAANVEKGRGRAWEMMVTLLWQGTEAIVQLSVACLFLSLIAPLAWAVMMVMLVLFLGSMVIINREVLRIGTELDKDFRAMNRRRADLWEHARLVIWADAADREIEALHAWSKKLISQDRNLWFPYITKADVRAMLVLMVVGGLFYAGIGWVEQGTLSDKELVPLGIWCMQIASALEQMRNLDRIINWNGPAIRAMRDDLEIPNDVPEHSQAVPVPNGPIGLRLKDVTYRYGDGDPVLKGISMSVEPGERVAIVGKSGSGKTTLMRLLQREMDVVEGAIAVSGCELPQVKRSSWRRAVGHIPQRPNPLNDTLRANLIFSLSEEEAKTWSDDALWGMLESVELGSKTRFSNGLDTLIGKRGLDLSGGEQQRLMIARALVKKPRVLLVDEATSSLDAETEEAVQRAIDTALGTSVTAIVIAHRLATIENVDRIVVLHDGRIIDQGTHVDLFERCGLFRRLCLKQKISYARAS